LNEFKRERINKWTEFMTKIGKNTYNQEQLEAVYSIINGANVNIPFILWGPPGNVFLIMDYTLNKSSSSFYAPKFFIIK
jgi:hypothetical protein